MNGERPRRDLGDMLGPEVVAAILAVALWSAAIFGPGLLAASGGPAASATPTPVAGGSPTPSGEAIDRSALEAASELNRQLVESGDALTAELAAPPLDTSAIASILRDMNVRLRVAMDVTDRLATGQATVSIAHDLRALYDRMAETNQATLGASLQNTPAYERGAQDVLALLEDLPPLEARIVALLETGVDPGATGPSPSAGPTSPSPEATPPPPASPSPSPSPSPTPSPVASPSSSPATSPSAALPSPDLSGNLVGDAGFEDAASSAWQLAVAPPAQASFTRDTSDPAAGLASARVTIEVGSASRSAISLKQSALPLASGERYLVGISARASEPREIRVRIASTTGETYGTRLFTIGPDWARFEFEFTAIVGDPGAVFAIDLGRSTTTAWFDDAFLGPPRTPSP